MADILHCRLTLIAVLLVLLMPATVFAQAPPQPIEYGQTVQGELNDVQQAIQYIFEAAAGDEISLLMQTTSGDLNTALSLATFEGDVVASDDDSGGGTDALIQVTLQEAGSYVVTAARSRAGVGGAGSFSLTLSLGALPTPEAQEVEVGPRLQPILRGTPLQGALTPESRFNLFWFEGRANEAIIVTSDPGAGLQPLLVLYDADFTEIVRGTGGSPLTASLPAADLYFIAAAAPGCAESRRQLCDNPQQWGRQHGDGSQPAARCAARPEFDYLRRARARHNHRNSLGLYLSIPGQRRGCRHHQYDARGR